MAGWLWNRRVKGEDHDTVMNHRYGRPRSKRINDRAAAAGRIDPARKVDIHSTGETGRRDDVCSAGENYFTVVG